MSLSLRERFMDLTCCGAEGGSKMAVVAGDDLLEAQSHIWNHAFAFINSIALKCAVQLGIPDAIDRHGTNPMPLSELVSALQLHPNKTQFIYRLMRILTHSKFFTIQKVSEDEEGYVLTNSSRLLLKDNPLTLAPFMLSVLEPGLLETSRFLPTWLRSEDRTPFDTAHGMSFWEYIGSKLTDEGEVFNASMASDAKLVTSILLEKYKGVFDGIESLVDVGGNTGAVAKAIVEAFPQMECTVFDLPQVVADFKGEGNLKFVGGDMFQAIPPADALLLKWILHDWSDEECVKILKKCKEAISFNEKRSRKVIVIDMVVGKDNKKRDDLIEAQLFSDITMMLVAGGKERDEKEWAQLIQEAGFSGYKIFPIFGFRSLIEIYP